MPGLGDVASPSWTGADPSLSVVVSTHRRPQFLAELFACLEDQTVPRHAYEVVIVDNCSDDGPGGTWDTLAELAARSPMRVRAVRSDVSAGPATGRNRGVSLARGWAVAFTDDDCLPQPGWLSALLTELEDGADLVQGQTMPDPSGRSRAGPWDRTVSIDAPTPFFETCNIAYRRAWLDRLGGFDEGDALTTTGAKRPFGEDAVLGAQLIAAGGAASFCEAAVVFHRWFPGSFREHVAERRRLAWFPGLANRSAVLRDARFGGVFLSKNTAATDLAIVGVVLAIARRNPLLLALVIPWVRRRWPEVAGSRVSPAAARRAAALAIGDAVGAASLLEGSVRHRRLVL